MEIQIEDSYSFLNLKTGEIILVSSEDLRAAEVDEPLDHLPDWQKESRLLAIDVLENDENYIELPTKYDINEYDMMEEFCLSFRDQQKQDILLWAIRGKGAFRRFKDKIIDLDIEDKWYGYKDSCYKQIAIEWCQDHDVKYSE